MARRKAINRPENEGPPAGSPDDVLQEPRRRRAWLLTKALEAHPLDRALELARAAEAFITQSRTQAGEESLASKPQPNIQIAKAKTPTGLSISAEQRDQLLGRLAEGATNAELAEEFGLSRRQVQGIRMGSAAEIATRRGRGE